MLLLMNLLCYFLKRSHIVLVTQIKRTVHISRLRLKLAILVLFITNQADLVETLELIKLNLKMISIL